MKQEVDYYHNDDLKNIETPIDADKLEQLLIESDYDHQETTFLINGFRQGFDLGYQGPINRQDSADNIPLTVGTKTDLWYKVMKEVKLKRFVGPFNDIPYTNYVQSPIGLVPKADNQVRLIFHLSYDFGSEEHQKSINYHTPHECCTVSYQDLDHAIRNSLRLIEETGTDIIYYAKMDIRSAFRMVPLRPGVFCLLMMKAEDPNQPGKFSFFVDKCLPFGASISCALFQRVSDALKWITEYRIRKQKRITNYLDDFLFQAACVMICNQMVRVFLDICDKINCPIADDKTEWATPRLVFLGVLLDGQQMILVIP